jgi:hypothetical protein
LSDVGQSAAVLCELGYPFLVSPPDRACEFFRLKRAGGIVYVRNDEATFLQGRWLRHVELAYVARRELRIV